MKRRGSVIQCGISLTPWESRKGEFETKTFNPDLV